ncbi:SUMF1/EgtB/PvdO family nonheme iron enzyme [Reichenbachiella sp. MALMAid0571]|uniref:formylglycine-generating enzyme family protein n=1 Tax=Reichenbachiella sp. MALMAid0571 TaxID=3143939 RepID=UPI0032DE44F5
MRNLISIFSICMAVSCSAFCQSFDNYSEVIQMGDKGESFKMVAIPGGQFKMGSPEKESNRKADEGPVHTVRIDSLWVGEFEMTWELFELYLNKNIDKQQTNLSDAVQLKVDAISRPSPPFEDPSLGMGKQGFPVVNISPYAALTFCKWLSTVTGHLYRLPTEAEWEYACRAGSKTAFHFGEDLSQLDEYAVYFDNSNGQYAKVGTKKANAWGLYDMHGNVSEWTLDLYDDQFYSKFEGQEADNPWNTPYVLHPRVYRGGSWDDDPEDLRSAARMKSGLNLQRGDPQVPKSFWWYTNSEFIGFRVVRSYKELTQVEIRKFWAKVLDE